MARVKFQGTQKGAAALQSYKAAKEMEKIKKMADLAKITAAKEALQYQFKKAQFEIEAMETYKKELAVLASFDEFETFKTERDQQKDLDLLEEFSKAQRELYPVVS